MVTMKKNKDKNNNKTNKECIIQVRCTKEEQQKLDRVTLEKGINRSDYIREKVFGKGKLKLENVQFIVLAQDIVEYVEEVYGKGDKELERRMKELWKVL